jgi:hypothetical protein
VFEEAGSERACGPARDWLAILGLAILTRLTALLMGPEGDAGGPGTGCG